MQWQATRFFREIQMNSRTKWCLLTPLCAVLWANTGVYAADGLDARTHSKVMKAKREQAMVQYEKTQNPQAAVTNGQQQPSSQAMGGADPCSAGVNVGNVYVDNNNRFGAPRENTVVVTGDVIFAPSRNCR